MSEQFAHYLVDLAAGRITLADFQDWFIDYVMGTEAIDPADIAVAQDIENALAEYSGGHISYAAFRGVVMGYVENLTIVSALPGFHSVEIRKSSAGRTLHTELLVVN